MQRRERGNDAARLDRNSLPIGRNDRNVPPWDTWLCFVQERDGSPWQPFDGYLLAWIPAQMIDRAERGIWINPEECIVWADSLDQPFIEEFHAAGLFDL